MGGAHPDRRSTADPNAVAWFDQGLACMGGTGLSEGEKASAVLLVAGFVRNHATMAADLAASFLAPASAPQDAMAAYARLLTKLTDRGQFPALYTVIASGAFDEPDDPDAEFVFGLERVLDGIDVLVRSRA